MKLEDIERFASIVEDLKDMIDVFIMPSSNYERQKLFPLRPFNGLFFAKSHR